MRVGQRATLQIEGSARRPGERRSQVGASVVRINPSAQAGSRSVLVYLRAGPQRRASARACSRRARIDVGRVEALALPLSAVRIDKPAPYVQMVIEGTHRAPRGRRPASAARSTARRMVAVSGVDDGAVVVGRQRRPAARRHAVRLPPHRRCRAAP